jgi:hypothetical protein
MYRGGFVMAEGAGVIVLETEEHALARGAPIYCELAGYGASCDAYHITAPAEGGEGLQDANVATTDVGYINAHGTSTQLNDKTETHAIKQVFGDHAYKMKVSSIKSMIGHSLGAAGGIEAVVSRLCPTFCCNTYSLYLYRALYPRICSPRCAQRSSRKEWYRRRLILTTRTWRPVVIWITCPT